MSDTSWQLAAGLLERFLKKPARLSHLLETLPSGLPAGSRSSCQYLLFGSVRHLALLRRGIEAFVRKTPRPGVEARLILASYELMEAPEKQAQIVDHAVGQIGKLFSKGEKGLANAVLRKVAGRLPDLLVTEGEGVGEMAWRYSHPEWMVKRWAAQFGLADTRAFLRWNQTEPRLFVRKLGEGAEDEAFLEATEWDSFYRLKAGAWKRVEAGLAEGRFYIQNPATSRSASLLAKGVNKGRALDVCAAPGGKTLLLDALLPAAVEEVVALDLPGPRIGRLRENVERYCSGRVRVVEEDLFDFVDTSGKRFDGVLLDAPCSNSGVLQHKIDAKWRSSPGLVKQLIPLQLKMLKRASRLVAPGGYLVYSTCSVDREENEDQVAAFLETAEGARFGLIEGGTRYPWVTGCDGSGAFLLQRASSGAGS